MEIKRRSSIHRGTRGHSTASSAAAPEPTNLSGSQEELSDTYESDNENRSPSSGEPDVKHSPPNKLNKNNKRNSEGSRIDSPNNTRDKFGDSFEPESAFPESSSGGSQITIVSIFVGGFIVLIGFAVYSNYGVKAAEEVKGAKFCSYSNLETKYPDENDFLWVPLKIVTENILNNLSDDPAVFLFVHNGTKKTNQLINDIAKTSSTCFDSSPNIQYIDFKSKEATEDYGYIIEKYKQTIKEGNVILIADLNEISAAAAKALHSICDTVSPIVKKVIIMLSLSAKRESNDEKIIYTAENALKQLWEAELEPFELDPIITRVTDQVLLLQTN